MQKIKTTFKSENILREEITEPKLIKNIINVIMLSGSIGFLAVGISSYLQFNIIPILDASKIIVGIEQKIKLYTININMFC
jgi:hypothetical protein